MSRYIYIYIYYIYIYIYTYRTRYRYDRRRNQELRNQKSLLTAHTSYSQVSPATCMVQRKAAQLQGSDPALLAGTGYQGQLTLDTSIIMRSQGSRNQLFGVSRPRSPIVLCPCGQGMSAVMNIGQVWGWVLHTWAPGNYPEHYKLTLSIPDG